jgi:hypothetical protein
MNKLVDNLISGEYYFGSGTQNTPQFNEFFNRFKKSFTYQLNKLGASDISFSKGHFYLSGFFKVQDRWIYFSLGDVRTSNNDLLMRTAKGPEDYTGGMNRYVSIENGMYKKIARAFGLEIPKQVNADNKDVSYYVEKAIKQGFLSMYIGSAKKADNIAWRLDEALKDEAERRTGITHSKYGRRIASSYCKTSKFNYYYSGDSKRMNIEIFGDEFDDEAFMKTLDIPNRPQLRANTFTGVQVKLEPEAVALHDFIKNAEMNLSPNFRNALLLFRERYPSEYMELLD